VDTYDVYAVHGWFSPPKISHVGIYLGDFKMLNANSAKGIVTERIDTPYWKEHFYSFGRVIP